MTESDAALEAAIQELAAMTAALNPRIFTAPTEVIAVPADSLTIQEIIALALNMMARKDTK